MTPRPGAAAERYIAALLDRARRSERLVGFDSAPLIDYLAQQEPTAALIEPIRSDPSISVVISVIALTEATTWAVARHGREGATDVRAALLSLPGFVIVDFDQTHAIETSIDRVETGL